MSGPKLLTLLSLIDLHPNIIESNALDPTKTYIRGIITTTIPNPSNPKLFILKLLEDLNGEKTTVEIQLKGNWVLDFCDKWAKNIQCNSRLVLSLWSSNVTKNSRGLIITYGTGVVLWAGKTRCSGNQLREQLSEIKSIANPPHESALGELRMRIQAPEAISAPTRQRPLSNKQPPPPPPAEPFNLYSNHVKYSQLAEMKEAGKYHVVAVAARTKFPYQKLSNWGACLKLYDQSSKDWYTFNCFKDRLEDLPDFVEPVAIVVLNNVKISASEARHGRTCTGFSDSVRSTVVSFESLRAGTVKSPDLFLNPQKVAFSPLVIEYMIELMDWWESENKTIEPPQEESFEAQPKVSAVRNTKQKRSFELICNVKLNHFYDLMVEVLHVHYRDSTEKADLKVTDYTSNPDLYDYSEVGVTGKRILQVSVWGAPNLRACSQLKKGRILFLRNVRIKESGSGALEATMVGDKRYPNKTDIINVNVEHPASQVSWKALSQRRTAYWDKIVNPVSQESLQLTSQPSKLPRCTLEQPIQHISDVLDQINRKTPGFLRLQGRIIDFYPSHFKDWIDCSCPRCEEPLPMGALTCMEHEIPPTTTLHFYLAIQDVNGQVIKVCVTKSEAADAFPGLNPRPDMREDGQELAARLSPVLGKLGECKRHKRVATTRELGPIFEFAVFVGCDSRASWLTWLAHTIFE